jgi:hypothetical protein
MDDRSSEDHAGAIGITVAPMSRHPHGSDAAATTTPTTTPTTTAVATVRVGRWTANVVPMLALALVGLIVPVLLAYQHRALGVPRGDDWSYLRTLFNWEEGNGLSFNNWVSMTLVGQLVLAMPIVWIRGRDIAAVQLGVAILGYIGLLAAVDLGRGIGLTRNRAWLVGFVVATGPFWGVLTVTFMTDVPGFAVSSIAIALGVRALRREQPALAFVIASLAVALLAFSIRQYAAVPGVALVPIALLQMRRTNHPRWKTFVGVLAVVAVVTTAFLLFWGQVPDAKPFTPGMPSSHSLRNLVYRGSGMLRLMGLWLLPCVLWRGTATIASTTRAVGKGLVVAVMVPVTIGLLFTGFNAPRIAFAGNYFVPNGVLADGVTAGRRHDIVPGWFWNALIICGTVGAALLVHAALPAILAFGKRVRTRNSTLTDPEGTYLSLCVAGYVGGYAVAALSGLPLYDRYVLPIMPIAAALLLRRRVVVAPPPIERIDPDVASSLLIAYARRSREALLAAGGVALLFGLSVLFTADSASFDGARWRVASDAVHQGWGPRQIAGSFEWDNYFSARPGTKISVRRGQAPCVRVTVDPRHRQRLPKPFISRRTYRAPFQMSVPVLAVRTRQFCVPAFRPLEP